MASPTHVTIEGNVTRDPEMQYTDAGLAWASFGVAVNKRVRNKATGEWEDSDPQFYDVVCFDSLADNVVESIVKGTRVIVIGQLNFRSWENDNGEKRSKVSVTADAIGPSLRWAAAVVTRNDRRSVEEQAVPAGVGAGDEPF